MKKNIFPSLMLAVFGLLMVAALFPHKVLAAEVTGTWESSDQIYMTDDRVTDKDKVLRQVFVDPSPGDAKRNFYVQGVNDKEDPNKCADVFKPSSDNTTGTLERWRGSDRDSLGGGSCNKYHTIPVRLRLVHNATEPAQAGSGSASATDSDSDRPDSCEQLSDALGWIVCPVILALDSAMNAVDSQIQGLLTVEEKYYDNDGIRAAASNIRGIAFIVLVPILLVMIIGTALGFNTIDAYTVKKALPRLFIAVIFISLSYNITVFLVELFNVIGLGALGIMTSPFDNTIDTLSLADLFGGSFFNSFVALPFVGLGAIILVWLFITPLVVAAATALLFLVLRQVIIVALLLVAPLAILSWIFPGRDKLWKSWWGIFSKLLMLFPLIMIVIAMGRIMAFILMESSGGPNQGSYISSLMKLLLYMVPYAFIPFSFKFVGGIMGNLAGMVNDKERGILDRAKKSRQAKYQRVPQGRMFKNAPENSWRSKLNTRAQQLAHVKHAGMQPSRWGTNIKGVITDKELEHGLEASEKLPGAKSFFASDDLMMAGLSGGGDYEKTYGYLAKDKGWTPDQAKIGASQALRLRQDMGNEAFNLAAVAKLPGTGTAFVGKDIGNWHKLVAKHTHGNKSLQASLVAAGKSGFRSSQRYEVSEAGFGDHLEAISMAERGENTQVITDKIVDSAYKGGGPAAVVGARNDDSAGMFTEAIKRDLRKASVSGDRNELLRSLAAVADIHDQMAGGKRIVTDVLAKEVMGYDVGGKPVLQLINEVRGDPDFQRARREIGRDIPPEFQPAAAQTPQSNPPGTTPPPSVGGGLQPPL